MTNIAPKWANISCENCGVIPLIADEMPANDLHNWDALDLVCSKCKLIIATLHADKPKAEHGSPDAFGDAAYRETGR
jgi:hypothetical protein